jgi:PPP family 3-phenylpropionic acid transporter
MPTTLFSRLSIIFLFYYSISGLKTIFLSVYLVDNGFIGSEIGEIFAFYITAQIIGPILFAHLTDLTGQPLAKIRFATLLALASFSLLFIGQSYWLITFSLSLFGLFWASILPLLEVLTLKLFDNDIKVYSRIRLWGSVGFISFPVLASFVFDASSSHAFVYLGAFVLLAFFGSSFSFESPSLKKNTRQKDAPILGKVLQVNFILFFLVGLLLTISFGPYSTFFVLYLQNTGYPNYSISFFFAVGVIAEITMFIYVGPLLNKFSIKALLIVCLLLTSLRWYLLGEFSEFVIILITSQLIHSVSYGLYHCVAMKFLKNHFSSQQQNRGQALYIAGVLGCGGALGAYVAGQLWLNDGNYQLAYNMAMLTALLGAVLALFMKNERNKNAGQDRDCATFIHSCSFFKRGRRQQQIGLK